MFSRRVFPENLNGTIDQGDEKVWYLNDLRHQFLSTLYLPIKSFLSKSMFSVVMQHNYMAMPVI